MFITQTNIIRTQGRAGRAGILCALLLSVFLLFSLQVDAQEVPEAVVIAIDPYGGGSQTGLLDSNGVIEKEITLAIARELRESLETRGFETILLRELDIDLPVTARLSRAYSIGADLILSIQCGAALDETINGACVYRESQGQYLATERGVSLKKIAARIDEEMDIAISDYASRGVRNARFAKEYQGRIPALFIEAGLLSSPLDAKRLTDPRFRKRLAETIASGVLNAYQEHRDGDEL